jgi:hypothetical protein
MKLGLSIISFVIAGMLLALALLLRRQNRNAYYITLIFFAGISLLTIFDELDWDIIVAAINIIPIVCNYRSEVVFADNTQSK